MIELDEIEFILMEIYAELGTPLRKSHVDSCAELPSYNTCVRRGLSLLDVNRRLREYNLKPTECLECHTLFFDKTKVKMFCTSSCSAKYNNRGRGLKRCKHRSHRSAVSKTTFCLFCNSINLNKKSKYCSQECNIEHKYRIKIENWISGLPIGSASAKNLLIRTHGYTCNHCGISEHNHKPLTLDLEHINGNSEDNSPENLCLLCPNCHSQTSTYKGKNKGNGRHSRMVRYHEGKSF